MDSAASESASGVRNYLIVTLAYWAFTLTDGAIRMLVVLHFNQLGYSAFAIASLFLFYEFFGIVTNLFGGWISARMGINTSMYMGMAIQIVALMMLTVDPSWLTVAYVMAAQALSGIAKDLNKMGAKSSLKVLVPDGEDAGSRLFKWVAILTGSKNALKGVGFFLGGLLLAQYGFRGALYAMSAMLLLVLLVSMMSLPSGMGRVKGKVKFTSLFSKNHDVNWLSAARMFLFGSRDVWFVVGLPVFFEDQLGWSFTQVGSFFALWVVGYGIVQAAAPRLVRRSHHLKGPDGSTASVWGLILFLSVAALTLSLWRFEADSLILVVGLSLFAIVFAVNSSVHSYLILAYSSNESVVLDVGFYYMANAAGRLLGTVLSGLGYQSWGLLGCLAISTLFVALSTLLSLRLPRAELRK